jgi:amidohydrolase
MTIDTATLRGLILEELPSLTSFRHDLHAHPELGYEEERTTSVVRGELEKAGIPFQGGLARGTGVLAHIDGKGPLSRALRADMDALPITEETGVPYASKTPGIMHACGHDGHTTILLGAARVLQRIAQEKGLPHPVTFVFQPAEEGGFAGGRAMVEDGCLDGSVLGKKVEKIFGLHGWPLFCLGTVGTREGTLLAASDSFELTIEGKGTHAAFPHLGNDVIVAGSSIVQAFQTAVSRAVDPTEPVVVSVTQFHAGTANNILSPRAELSGTVRTLSDKTRSHVEATLVHLAETTARAHGCTASFRLVDGYPVTRNAPEAVKDFHRAALETLPDDRLIRVERPVMGGEDFSYYGEKVPACFFFLGLRPEGKTSMPSLHHPAFDFNDDALPLGIELFCRLALGE